MRYVELIITLIISFEHVHQDLKQRRWLGFLLHQLENKTLFIIVDQTLKVFFIRAKYINILCLNQIKLNF